MSTPAKTTATKVSPAARKATTAKNTSGAPKASSAPKATKFEKVRRARLTLSSVNIGSVVKVALLLSVAMLVMFVVASIILILLMNITGIMGQIDDFMKEVAGQNTNFNAKDVFSIGHVVAISALVGVANVFFMTAISALLAFVYNITATMVGGVGITLTDD
ncbi:MAG: DUF3566 domain-containing protein [Micrococcaceae bacterium]